MLAVLLAAVTVSGAFQLKASTPRGDVYVLAEAPNLRVDPKRCDIFLESVERRLGARAPRYTYYRVRDVQDITYHAGEYAQGVTKAWTGEVWSMEACQKHEMVHLVTHQLGHPGRFWNEGLATALGDSFNESDGKKLARKTGSQFSVWVRLFSWWVSDGARNDEAVQRYKMAGSFMRYLIARHGMAKVVEYFRACRIPDKDGTVFKRIFGRSVQEEGESWFR